MNYPRDLQLLYEVDCLRHLPRVWRQFGGPNVANVAEHSLRVMWPKSRNWHWYMILVRAGLVTATVAGTSVADRTNQLYEEFAAAETPEAKIVKDADNLDADLEFAERRSNWTFADTQRAAVREYESLRQAGTVGAAERE